MITKEEKLLLIKNITQEHDISAYMIGQNTTISASSAHKILSGEQKNPRTKTLNIILEFLEKEIAGSENSYELEDQQLKNGTKNVALMSYDRNFNDLKIDDKLNSIDAKLHEIRSFIQILMDTGERTKKNGEKTMKKVDQNEKLIGQTNRALFEQSMNIQDLFAELEEKANNIRRLS